MIERWKPIPDYESLYEVSDRGRVRSIRSHKIRRFVLMEGYPRVALCKNGIRYDVMVHRLVLLAFVGPRPTGHEARHYPDQDKTNNRLSNLSWCTHFVNQRDRDTNGTNNKGTRNTSAKLNNKTVRYIRSIKQWPYGTVVKLARRFGTSSTVIISARNRKTWRHL